MKKDLTPEEKRERKNLYNVRYYAKHRDELAQGRKTPEFKAKMKAWRATHKELIKEQQQNWYSKLLTDPERYHRRVAKVSVTAGIWKASHRSQVNQTMREWRERKRMQ